MKNNYSKILLAFSIIAAGFFSSCSKQITSITKSEKMLSMQTLATNSQNHTLCPPENNVFSTKTDYYATPLMLKSAPGETLVKTNHLSKNLATPISDKIIKGIKKQTASIQVFSSHNTTTAYKAGNHTEGMLGIAGVFLIAAICMAVLGLTQMGGVFWVLSVILFVSAAVFFLLYLVGKAVSPESE